MLIRSHDEIMILLKIWSWSTNYHLFIWSVVILFLLLSFESLLMMLH